MFFLWPTINDRTLSGERAARVGREGRLSLLESRMDEFLLAKQRTCAPEVLERVRVQKQRVAHERENLRKAS